MDRERAMYKGIFDGLAPFLLSPAKANPFVLRFDFTLRKLEL